MLIELNNIVLLKVNNKDKQKWLVKFNKIKCRTFMI